MRVDIIIPTYKPDDTFCLLLQKLQEQTFVIHEIVLVNTERQGYARSLVRTAVPGIWERGIPKRIF